MQAVQKRRQTCKSRKLCKRQSKISKAADSGYGAVSVVMENNNGKRSFKISYKKPDGKSYAHEIAYKYGITFEQLSKNSDKIKKLHV